MSQPPVPPSGTKQPVVETPPDGDAPAEVSRRSLNFRIRQQEILAELGVTALKGTAFEKLLDMTVSLAAGRTGGRALQGVGIHPCRETVADARGGGLGRRPCRFRQRWR